jgi:hypothetical protein
MSEEKITPVEVDAMNATILRNCYKVAAIQGILEESDADNTEYIGLAYIFEDIRDQFHEIMDFLDKVKSQLNAEAASGESNKEV